MRPRWLTKQRAAVFAWIAGAVITVDGWRALVVHRAGDFPIAGGGTVMPEGMGARSLWVFAGVLAVLLATRGFSQWAAAGDRSARVVRRWSAGRDTLWVAGAALFALAAALAVRTWALHGFDVTGTEPAYRFQAHLILGAHPYAVSPRFKLFFDTDPMIGDGRWYPPHGPGWPLLLAPFLAARVPGLAAPVLLAATVPGLFLIVRRWAGAPWARLAIVLLALSPMAVLGAATELSGAAALCAATWSLWALLRACDEGAPPWAHALLGAGIGLGLAIHPWMAAGWGLPLGVAWLLHARRERLGLAPILAFALPLLAAIGALLALQAARTGSPFTTGWDRLYQYAAENHYRFTSITPKTVPPWVLHRDLGRAIAFGLIGGFRFALTAWGVPIALLPAIAAGRQRGGKLLLALALGILLAGGFGPDGGPDLFGPTRFYVLLLPAVCGIVLGLRTLSGTTLGGYWRFAPVAGIAAVLLVAVPTWAYVETWNLRLVVGHVRLPRDLTRRLHDAVVFVPNRQYAPWCARQRVRNPDRSIPVNLPSLDAPVIWVNHVNLADDKQFLKVLFPQRSGWFVDWNVATCTARLKALSHVTEHQARDGLPHSRAAEPATPPPWR